MTTLIERGFPGHFICADRCRYRRCTDVNGKWRVSTVGAYTVNEGDSEWTTVGCDRFFETMVFRLGDLIDPHSKAQIVEQWGGIEMAGYNTMAEADAGHDAMVQKWSGIDEWKDDE